jgi:DNA-binding GntR family transcriptional regulator
MTIDRSGMREQIRNLIVARIAEGVWPPGTRLKQADLSTQLNVSQAPVREALRELEGAGILVSDRYRGVRVRAIDLVELGEAYELRAEIEEAAARRAVPCSAKRLSALEDELVLMNRASKKKDVDAYLAAAVRFHRTLVEMSGNRLFLRAWELMAWDIRARLAVRRFGLLGLYSEERAAIVDALRRGDGEAAGRCVRAILEHLIQRIRIAAIVGSGDL